MTMSSSASRRPQGAEWKLDAYVDSDAWARTRSDGLGTINLTLSCPGSNCTLTSNPLSGEPKRFNEFTSTRFGGSTRLTQYENDRRADLKAHYSRRGLANTIDHAVVDVGRAERMRELYEGITATHTAPPEATKGRGVDKDNSASLERIWRDKLPDCDPELLTVAMRQMKGPEAGKVDASDLVLPAPAFAHGTAVQKVKKGASGGQKRDTGLMSAPQRRQRAEEELQSLRAASQLGRARRTYKHLEFIASKRHNNGVLMSEHPDQSPSGVYRHVAQAKDQEVDIVKRERGMRTQLQSGNHRNGQILYHTATLEDTQKPFLPRKNHGHRIKDSFSVSETGEPTRRENAKRMNTLVYANTRGNDRDIITGAITQNQSSSPYV